MASLPVPSIGTLKALTAAWIYQQDPHVVVAPEVTHYVNGRALRLDVCALRPCAPARIWGIEIKRFRADFTQDKKWKSYLPFVHLMYFLCPGPEVIAPEELPKAVGLLYCPSNKIQVHRRAQCRSIDNEQLHLLNFSMMLLRHKLKEMSQWSYLKPTYIPQKNT
ncbi:MmcB family DNA repair protein [Candidatus Woesearchaeota archaeon]|nr:MmcB family DNA repair protein [Candidatus Woesearchaeota archaeon]